MAAASARLVSPSEEPKTCKHHKEQPQGYKDASMFGRPLYVKAPKVEPANGVRVQADRNESEARGIGIILAPREADSSGVNRNTQPAKREASRHKCG